MGNAESRATEWESEFYNVVKYVPVVGEAYSIPRMLVYTAEGNTHVVLETATGMLGNLAETGLEIAGATAGAGGVVAATATAATVWRGLEEIEKVAERSSKKEEDK